MDLENYIRKKCPVCLVSENLSKRQETMVVMDIFLIFDVLHSNILKSEKSSIKVLSIITYAFIITFSFCDCFNKVFWTSKCLGKASTACAQYLNKKNVAVEKLINHLNIGQGLYRPLLSRSWFEGKYLVSTSHVSFKLAYFWCFSKECFVFLHKLYYSKHILFWTIKS